MDLRTVIMSTMVKTLARQPQLVASCDAMTENPDA